MPRPWSVTIVALFTLVLLCRGALAASPRLQPLVPDGVRLTADPQAITDGVLPVDLSAQVYEDHPVRLDGIVMMLTQFPEVRRRRIGCLLGKR